jgi:hypothetical protein
VIKACKILVRKCQKKYRCRWEDNIKINVREIEYEGVAGWCEHTTVSGSTNAGTFLTVEAHNLFSRKTPNVVIEWVTFLHRIQEVIGSNLGPENGYAD